VNTKNKEVNYLSLFFLGLSLLSTGLIFTAAINPAFISIMASGLGLMAIALANRDKWPNTNQHTQE
jgi:ABC-type uncharacterized transport system permease subunit